MMIDFAPEILLPAQLGRRDSSDEWEVRLALAIVESALRDYRRHSAEVRDWLRTTGRPFSAEWAADVLGVGLFHLRYSMQAAFARIEAGHHRAHWRGNRRTRGAGASFYVRRPRRRSNYHRFHQGGDGRRSSMSYLWDSDDGDPYPCEGWCPCCRVLVYLGHDHDSQRTREDCKALTPPCLACGRYIDNFADAMAEVALCAAAVACGITPSRDEVERCLY